MRPLEDTSISSAIGHLTLAGDTDFFQPPFEIEALADTWQNRKALLEPIDLNSYVCGGSRRFIVPKSKFSYRVITQLDPLDSLVLTSLVCAFGDLLENHRVP